jgi:hypothetical protein
LQQIFSSLKPRQVVFSADAGMAELGQHLSLEKKAVPKKLKKIEGN